jgi:N-methylhydantoinase B
LNRTEPAANHFRDVDRQIMWNRLLAVVEEQAQTLVRTAFSTAVREAGDLSAGVFDRQGRMLAQAVTGTPGHVNAMASSVGYFLDKIPLTAMHVGDVFVTNDPWYGTGHLNDFTVVTPTFLDGHAVALFAATVHVVDVGGLGFGPDGREVFEEGINIPILPLFTRGEPNRQLFEILGINGREPRQVEGDLYSLAACNEIGGRRLCEMMREFRLADLDGLADAIVAQSHAAMLAEIRELPFGTYANAMRVDGYEAPLDLVATMTIGDTGIDIDFTGTSGVSSHGVNVPMTYTQAYASFGVRCIVGSAVPNNAGSLAPIRVFAPEGTILNAPRPRAVSARHTVGHMLPDVVLGCLHQALGDRIPAEGASCLWIPVFHGGHGIVGAAEYGDAMPFAMNTFHAGGTGGRPGKDGLSATAFPSGVRNTPVEINETIAPILVLRKEYRQDSGGAGRYRGGLGQVMEVTHADGRPFAVSAMFDRIVHPARGLAGGANGATGNIRLKSGATLNRKGRQLIPAGETLVLELPGGGGLGDPAERSIEAIAADLRNGLISEEAAERDYHVVVGPNGTVSRRTG